VSVYFTYTTLLTIGYGDFYPTSPSGKPFFVIWSLVAVPAMTVLISNMGDTVVGWVQDATVWVSRWTILPERPVQMARRTMRRQKHKIQRSMPGSRKESGDVISLPLKALSHGSEDASTSSPPLQPLGNTGNDLPHPDSLPTQNEPYQETPALDNETALEQDIERIGSTVEHFEEDEGRGNSLAARLAREISILAKDLDVKPPKKYDWEDWVRWLDMLGEMDNHDGNTKEPEKANAEVSESAEDNVAHPEDGVVGASVPKIGEGMSGEDARHSAGETVDTQETAVAQSHSDATAIPSVSQNDGGEWLWTWLGDHGPLFSRLTETEWVIERLCFRLEEVIVDEIREARASGLREGDR
jgi:potassium channel subfamily K